MYGSVLANAFGPGTLFAPACPSVSLFFLSGSIPSFPCRGSDFPPKDICHFSRVCIGIHYDARTPDGAFFRCLQNARVEVLPHKGWRDSWWSSHNLSFGILTCSPTVAVLFTDLRPCVFCADVTQPRGWQLRGVGSACISCTRCTRCLHSSHRFHLHPPAKKVFNGGAVMAHSTGTSHLCISLEIKPITEYHPRTAV